MKEEEDDVKRLKADMRRSFIFLAPGYEKEVDLIEEGLSLNSQQQKQTLYYCVTRAPLLYFIRS